jgi:2,4-dienoyl-CoA reductase-like NADH-dependent reductase (Old Yellow Enzyme family)
MNKLFEPFIFNCGLSMKNRFMLAPLTNTQSHEDGSLSEDEFHWLIMRAKGGFGLTMTCASHVQKNGKGFPGQLGIYDDMHMEGHSRLTKSIRSTGSLAVIQLHHAGIRSPKELVKNKGVGPSDYEKSGARGLLLKEVHALRDAFIDAGIRAHKSGYNGVEIHGAHGYIICQFLSSKYNLRQDDYGGSLENRSRLLFEIVEGIRSSCEPEFLIGVRLSPERFGMELEEIKTVCKKLIDEKNIDFLDISLWDSFKEPEESKYKGKSLLSHFTAMDFGSVRLTVAGQIRSGADAKTVMEAGVDFVTIGRSAILHHNFPEKIRAIPNFEPTPLPVSRNYLRNEGLGEDFINYMSRWPDFVASN